MDENWIRKEVTEENDAIIDLIDDIDMYEYILPDEDDLEGEDYYMVEPKAWEKAYRDYKNGRNRKKELEIEHELWERSSKLIQLGLEALSRKDMDEAIALFEESITLKSRSNYPYYELTKIYKKRHDVQNELRICKIAAERMPTLLQYQKRIRELEGTQPAIKAPSGRRKVTIDGTTFGDKLYNLFDSLTKDDLYLEEIEIEEDNKALFFSETEIFEIDIDKSTDEEELPRLLLKEDKRSELSDYYDYMYNASNLVKEAAALDDYCQVVDIYERILSEEVPYYDYYESLRGSYQKFRLREAELEMLKEVINLAEKDTIRYNKLINKIMTWFPDADFSEDYPYLDYGYIHKPYSKQIKKWKERIVWLEERINKKKRK